MLQRQPRLNMVPFSTLSNSRLTVGFFGSDCGSFTTGNTFDEFALYQDDKMVAVLRCEYDNDSKTPVTTALTVSLDVAELPSVSSALHLSAAIIDTVMQAFSSDHEFYHQVFQDEDGDLSVRLPLLIAA